GLEARHDLHAARAAVESRAFAQAAEHPAHVAMRTRALGLAVEDVEDRRAALARGRQERLDVLDDVLLRRMLGCARVLGGAVVGDDVAVHVEHHQDGAPRVDCFEICHPSLLSSWWACDARRPSFAAYAP